MVVFLDTNVILDAYFERPGHGEAASKVMNLCAERKVDGFVSTGVLTDTVFIAQKILKSDDNRKIIPLLCRILNVISADGDCIIRASENEDMQDFEDAIRLEEASICGADYVVTSNIKDYRRSKITAITPEDFLTII